MIQGGVNQSFPIFLIYAQGLLLTQKSRPFSLGISSYTVKNNYGWNPHFKTHRKFCLVLIKIIYHFKPWTGKWTCLKSFLLKFSKHFSDLFSNWEKVEQWVWSKPSYIRYYNFPTIPDLVQFVWFFFTSFSYKYFC